MDQSATAKSEIANRSHNIQHLIIATVCFGLATLIVAIILLDRSQLIWEHRWSLTAASLSITIAIFTGIRALRVDGRSGSIHAIFLVVLTLFMSFPSIIFSLSNSNLTYNTLYGPVMYLSNPTRVQTAVLLFIISYSCITFIPIPRPPHHSLLKTKLHDIPQLFTVTVLVASNAYLLLVPLVLPKTLVFALNASRIYFTPLFIVVGMRWSQTSRLKQNIVVFSLVITGILKLIMNARQPALLPVIFLTVGYLLTPGLESRKKTVVSGLVLCLIPLILIIGNQSRIILGPVGDQATFQDRLEAMQSTVGSGQLKSSDGFVLDITSRLYPTGANAIISFTPSVFPFEPFDPELFVREAITSLSPSSISGDTQLTPKQYVGSTPLIVYGFYITDSNSVEVNIIGSLFRMGGFTPILIGGIILGILHRITIVLINHALHRSYFGLILLSSVAAAAFSAVNLDIISITSSLTWCWIFSGLIYLVLKYFVPNTERHIVLVKESG